MSWLAKAVCKTTSTNVFFPEPGSGNGWSAALRVCSGCPVRGDCLDYALRTNQTQGVWGMTTPAERQEMLRFGQHGATVNGNRFTAVGGLR